MQIKIKTTIRKFFRQYLELLGSIAPFSKLRNRELDVLAEILYQHYKYIYIKDRKVRKDIVFSVNNRVIMRNKINMGEDTYNNNLSILRKQGFITQDNDLPEYFDSVLSEVEKKTLIFTFEIDKEEGEEEDTEVSNQKASI